MLRPTAEGAAALQPARGAAFAVMAAIYFGYSFIGLHPLADVSVADRLEGSALDRLAGVCMFVAALAVLWRRRREAMAALIDRPGFVIVSAIIGLSAIWSDYPDLTVRRAALYLMLAVTGLAVAVSARDPRRLHSAMFAMFVGVAIVNLLATAIAPAIAISDLGVRGVYTQKNVAGAVAMAGVIVGVFWTAGARGSERRLGALGAALISAFLVVTKSKTSLTLAVLACGLGGLVAFVALGGRRAALVVIAGTLLASLTLFGLFAASGFDAGRALDILIGDSTFTGRDQLWAFASNHIALRPWGGHGYGAYWDVGLANDPIAKLDPGAWLGDSEVGVINQAHNGYLDLALNIGVPATILAGLTVLAAMLRALARAHRPELDRRARAAHGAFAALSFAFLLHNLTEATLFLRGAPLWALIVVVLFAPA